MPPLKTQAIFSKKIQLFITILFFAAQLNWTNQAWAGYQKEEDLSFAVASTLRRAVGGVYRPRLIFANETQKNAWLTEMRRRLSPMVQDTWLQNRLLTAIHYEANRAGLDPQLVLAVIHIESGFRSYAISHVGARGLMQVMPFWVRTIGSPEHNLFDLQTNLRYGCTILRHYLDRENGNLDRALARYNGSLGRSVYSNKVLSIWKNYWHWNEIQ